MDAWVGLEDKNPALSNALVVATSINQHIFQVLPLQQKENPEKAIQSVGIVEYNRNGEPLYVNEAFLEILNIPGEFEFRKRLREGTALTYTYTEKSAARAEKLLSQLSRVTGDATDGLSYSTRFNLIDQSRSVHFTTTRTDSGGTLRIVTAAPYDAAIDDESAEEQLISSGRSNVHLGQYDTVGNPKVHGYVGLLREAQIEDGKTSDVAEVLLRSAEYVDKIFELSHIGIAAYDGKNLVVANESLADITGYPIATMKQLSVDGRLTKVLYPSRLEQDYINAHYEKIANGKMRHYSEEFFMRRADGKEQQIISSTAAADHIGFGSGTTRIIQVRPKDQHDQELDDWLAANS